MCVVAIPDTISLALLILSSILSDSRSSEYLESETLVSSAFASAEGIFCIDASRAFISIIDTRFMD